MRFFASQGLAGDISDVWGNRQRDVRRAQEGLHRATTASSTSSRSTTTRGRSSTGRASSEKGYKSPKTLDELKTLGTTDAEGRPHPDRLRRQGRLAGDGHLRPAQPAHQRLRLPRQPDGRQGGLGRRRRSRRSSTPGTACCPSTRPTRSAAPGRRPPSRCSRRSPACTCSAPSSPSSSPRAPSRTTSTSSPSRRSTRPSARTPSRRPIDGFMMAKRPKNEDGGEEAADVPRRGRTPRTSRQGRPERSPPTTRPTSRLHHAAEEGRRVRQAAKQIAQFLDRDTRPDFASTVMIPALQSFIKNPTTSTG